MTDFQNKNLVKPFLEKKSQGRKYEGKFRFRQKMQQHRNRYQNLILVSVADTETRVQSYTTLYSKKCTLPCITFPYLFDPFIMAQRAAGPHRPTRTNRL